MGIQIIKDKKADQGSREHDLLGEFVMILATVIAEKHGKGEGGESGEMCCEMKEVGKVGFIFS